MSTYCEKFGLLPSETPQVVTTTKHPDSADIGGKIVANLSGDALNSARVLTDLTNELLRTGLNQSSLDESEWGRSRRRSIHRNGFRVLLPEQGVHLDQDRRL
jgi:hypothetical protein